MKTIWEKNNFNSQTKKEEEKHIKLSIKQIATNLLISGK